jgi:hypothetical protein
VTTLDIEPDDDQGRWCGNCLAMSDAALALIDQPAEGNVIVYDENSGRFLCVPCKTWGDEHLYPRGGDTTGPSTPHQA